MRRQIGATMRLRVFGEVDVEAVAGLPGHATAGVRAGDRQVEGSCAHQVRDTIRRGAKANLGPGAEISLSFVEGDRLPNIVWIRENTRTVFTRPKPNGSTQTAVLKRRLQCTPP